MSDIAYKNTDHLLWRAKPGDFYSDSVHVTEGGGIGINVGGTVIVRTPSEWHQLARELAEARLELERLTDALLTTLDGRCYACGWDFSADGKAHGCEPGNCSFRPSEHTPGHDVWLERQKWICELQASAAQQRPTDQ